MAIPLSPADLWQSWSLEPASVISIVLAGALYLRGVRALWSSAGAGHGIRRGEVVAFAAGLVVLVIALLSPLDALAPELLVAHMVQHLLLVLVAPPLLLLGEPALPFLWALPIEWRRRIARIWLVSGPRLVWRTLTRPTIAVLLHAIALWAWHLPRPYEAALTSPTLHALEHASFLLTALLFWWMPVHPRRVGYTVAMLATFSTALQSGLLGALLTFSQTPWYPTYAASEGAWGISPLADQQLAGLIMWIPAGAGYLLVVLLVLGAWLASAETSEPPAVRDARGPGSDAPGVRPRTPRPGQRMTR